MVCKLLEGKGQWKKLILFKSGDVCFGHFQDGW
jgi:hypothetical protein